jgi:hypothetical protein
MQGVSMVIIKAAIMFENGETVEGHDYGHISSLAQKLGIRGERVLGFMTSSGEFVLPGEAAVIAVESGQLKSVLGPLTPDMLWKTAEIEF